jgi:hypothetical protein
MSVINGCTGPLRVELCIDVLQHFSVQRNSAAFAARQKHSLFLSLYF